jgi:hypothetical protein
VWITCPCLKQNKGGLAGATLNGKIFAIGGGNGSQSFSEVEMFDPAHGSWIHSPSLQQSVWSQVPLNSYIEYIVLNLTATSLTLGLYYWRVLIVMCDKV